MIKKKNIIISALTAMLIVTLAVMCFYANTMGAKLQVNVRNVELNAIELDYSSIINQFENAKVTKEGSVTTFEGYQTLDASLFEGLDNVSESDIESSVGCQIKYNFTYDSEANIVTLSAIMENGEKLEIEEIYGSAFIDENGRLDAVMDFDGEYVLLSEMQDMGLIQNCGWFSRLFKKVVKAVVAVAAVAVCVATAGAGVAAVIAIGAAVGAAESVATQLIETGTVCLGAVLVDTALGAIPGGTGAKTVAKESAKLGAEIAAKKAAKEASEKVAKETAEKVVKKAELGNKLEFAFGKASGNVHNVERSMQNASQLSKIGIHDNKTGREILENHFNKSFNDNASQILAEGSGRVEIYSLLSGPGGFLNVKSVWEGKKLITFWFIG